MRTVHLAVRTSIILAWASVSFAVDPYAGNDPYWILLHEPAVVEELKLSSRQRKEYRKLTDGLDLRFFPLRNKPRDEAVKGLAEITADARKALNTLLDPAQRKRLSEILFQKLGASMLLRDEVEAQMRYTNTQRTQVMEIIDATQLAVAALQKAVSDGQPREPLDKKFSELKTEEQKKLLQLLTPEQQTLWKKLVGSPFALSKLGRPAIKAPQLVDTGEWINSPPLRLDALHGKVVVVHFYACDCINCIHNYPSYRAWHDHFRDQDVVLIGIQTPETSAERDVAQVRKKAAEEKLVFPILMDGKSENWNAWGNSMWPAVYVLDQRGYLRHFWPGELKWQGNDGEKFIRERIEALLAEPGPQ